jgi:hypothetical protein
MTFRIVVEAAIGDEYPEVQNNREMARIERVIKALADTGVQVQEIIQ